MAYDQIPGWTCSEIEALYSEFAAKAAEQYRRGFNPGEEPKKFTVVEVGVAFGRSLAYLAERCPPNVRIVGVDVWTEHMGGDNLNPEVFKRLLAHGTPKQACEAELRAALSPENFAKIELNGTGSLEAAKLFENNSIDLVMIDACHEFEPVMADIRAWLPKVKAPVPLMSQERGMLAGHDYSLNMFPGVVKAVESWFGMGRREIRGVVWRYEPYFCDDGGCRRCTYCIQHYHGAGK